MKKRIPDECEMPFFPNIPKIFSVIYVSIFSIHFLATLGLFCFGIIRSGIMMLILGICLLILSIIFLKKTDRHFREKHMQFLKGMEREGRIADREIKEMLEREFGPKIE